MHGLSACYLNEAAYRDGVEAVITRTKIESVTKMRRVEILNTSAGAEMCRLRIGWIYK